MLNYLMRDPKYYGKVKAKTLRMDNRITFYACGSDLLIAGQVLVRWCGHQARTPSLAKILGLISQSILG